ncbi:MAG: hypothetical protein M0002_01925 [Rhodospirillales bacterium]|nr:hypothetical protein [Rhodospirillales bacterium]
MAAAQLPEPVPIEERIEALMAQGVADAERSAAELLAIGEVVIERFVLARGLVPTEATHEGFRLLALQRQGAAGEPSFNACRESCRELVYHANLLRLEPWHPEAGRRVRLGAMIARHLMLFIDGKLEIAGLGEFCCAARPLRAAEAAGA